jgi:Zn-dependent peptidase ImmA (M78 family)
MIDIESLAAHWARIVTLPMEHGVQGAYDKKAGAIYVADSLSDVQRRCVLAHELSHARHRDMSCLPADSTMELRADMEAARLLISPAEYASAEAVCDGVWWLARELGVTVGMIVAYRHWLHESSASLPCEYQGVD